MCERKHRGRQLSAPHEITTHGLLMAAAQGLLPPWARRKLHLVYIPAGDRLAVRPAARALSTALRWVVEPPGPADPPTVDQLEALAG
jgi:hypothetical protein